MFFLPRPYFLDPVTLLDKGLKNILSSKGHKNHQNEYFPGAIEIV